MIAHTKLQELRNVAARSDCPLADILLAVFGLVLDRHAGHGDGSITILSADQTMPGRRTGQRVETGPEGSAGATMPLEMRLAIARGASATARQPSKCRGVAFRHTRCGLAQDRIAPEPSAAHLAACQDTGDFDLGLDIREFDDMLLMGCFFRTRAVGLGAVERLVRDYAHALQAVVKSFDSEP